MKKLTLFLLILPVCLHAQHTQDPMQYNLNPILFNPSYAGSQNALNITGMYMKQWVRMEGAPEAKVLSMHMPLRNRKVNLGAVLEDRRISIFSHTKLSFIYAYRILLDKGSISLGLAGGADIYTGDWNKVVTTTANDPRFAAPVVRRAVPVTAAGAHYRNERLFVGFSMPRLELSETAATSPLHFNTSYLFDLGKDFKWKPWLLARYLRNSPLSVDLTSMFYYQEVAGLGVGYNHRNSVSFLADIRIKDQLFFAYGYSVPCSRLGTYTGGSHELMLRYLFSYKIQSVNSRFF